MISDYNSENSEEEEVEEEYNPYDLLNNLSDNIEDIWNDVVMKYVNDPKMEILQKLDKFDSDRFYNFFTNNSNFYNTIIDDIKVEIKKQKKIDEMKKKKELEDKKKNK